MISNKIVCFGRIGTKALRSKGFVIAHKAVFKYNNERRDAAQHLNLKLIGAPPGSADALLDEISFPKDDFPTIVEYRSVALYAWHQCKAVHRDIKPSNLAVGVCPASKGLRRLCLLDVETAAVLPALDAELPACTEGFQAPEVERGEKHGLPVDLFTAGMTIQAWLSAHTCSFTATASVTTDTSSDSDEVPALNSSADA